MKSHHAELIEAARTAKRRAHAPYSRFHVGAAIESTSGRIYTGCNVENSSYGLTICAERTAIFKAISEGERYFKAIAIVADDKDFTPPCGACRQVLLDLAGNIDIVMVNARGRKLVKRLKDLLPFAFSDSHLAPEKKRKK